MSDKLTQPRFSLYQASQEWGIHRESLGKALTKAGIPKNDDGYTIREINSAVFPATEQSQAAEDLRLTTAAADEKEIKNAASRLELVEVADFSRRLEVKAAEVKQSISDLEWLTEDQQTEILEILSKIFTP